MPARCFNSVAEGMQVPSYSVKVEALVVMEFELDADSAKDAKEEARGMVEAGDPPTSYALLRLGAVSKPDKLPD